MIKFAFSKPRVCLLILTLLAMIALGFVQGSRNGPQAEAMVEAGPHRPAVILVSLSIANVVISIVGALVIAHKTSVQQKMSSGSVSLDSNREAQPLADDPSRLDLRVLVVEENPVSRRVLLRLLDRIGCSAEAVTDGPGVARTREIGGHDVILMDVESHGLNGWSTTLEIRQVESERGMARIPILAMTFDSTDAGRMPVQEVGIDGYVLKPVSRDLLFAALSEWARPIPGRSMAETSVFDFESLLVRCSGDRILADELIATFLASSAETMENLRRASESDDALRLKVEAHGLAGSSRTIGANALAGHCLTLETTARLENFGAARAILSRVKLEWDTLRPILELRLRETS